MGSTTTSGGLTVRRADDESGDIILRIAPSAWALALVAFSIGVLVGLLLD